MIFQTLTANDIVPYSVVFARLFTLMLMLPGFGDISVPVRTRTYLTFALSISLTPYLEPFLTPLPPESLLPFLLVSEAIYGLFLGTCVKILMTTLDLVGSIIGMQMSFSNAFVQSTSSGQQSSVIVQFLYCMVALFIFSLDIHHFFLKAFVQSYSTLKPWPFLYLFETSPDINETLLRYMEVMMRLTVQLSAPFLFFSLVTYVMMGFLNRLIPQVQIFFVAQPFHIFLGLFVLFLVLNSFLNLFYEKLIQNLPFV